MTEDLKTRITRVAQIAQRNARNHEDQVEAQALIDEMAATPSTIVVDHPVPSSQTVKVEDVVGGPLAHDSKFVPGQDVVVAAEPTAAAPVDVATADTSPEIPTGDWKFGTWQGPVTAPQPAESPIDHTQPIPERLREKGKGSRK